MSDSYYDSLRAYEDYMRGDQDEKERTANLNYCQVCGRWLGMDDYDGICTECDNACEYCGGERQVIDHNSMTDAYGIEREIPCPRCKGTGIEPDEKIKP